MTTLTRRAFAGGVAGGFAALLLPKLSIRPQYDLHTIAKQWCDDGSYTRWDLTNPYLFEDLVYATDGRAMVFFSDEHATAVGDTRVPRNTAYVRSEFWCDAHEWSRLPVNPPNIYEDSLTGIQYCAACMINGGECSLCEGDGCDGCKWNGWTARRDCRICHGKGMSASGVVLADQVIGVEYYDRLLGLPGVQLHPSRDAESPLMFRSECGISGLIMPRITAER